LAMQRTLGKIGGDDPPPRANQLIYHGAYAPRGVKHERAWSEAPPAHGQWDRGRADPGGADGTVTGVDSPNNPSGERPVGITAGGGEDRERSPPQSASSALPPRPPPEIVGRYVRPRHHAWADLLRRTFELDILACSECGGRLRLLATITQRAVIERILAHLGLPTDPVVPEPARYEEELFA
jgi:hypothetical protein